MKMTDEEIMEIWEAGDVPGRENVRFLAKANDVGLPAMREYLAKLGAKNIPDLNRKSPVKKETKKKPDAPDTNVGTKEPTGKKEPKEIKLPDGTVYTQDTDGRGWTGHQLEVRTQPLSITLESDGSANMPLEEFVEGSGIKTKEPAAEEGMSAQTLLEILAKTVKSDTTIRFEDQPIKRVDVTKSFGVDGKTSVSEIILRRR